MSETNEKGWIVCRDPWTGEIDGYMVAAPLVPVPCSTCGDIDCLVHRDVLDEA